MINKAYITRAPNLNCQFSELPSSNWVNPGRFGRFSGTGQVGSKLFEPTWVYPVQPIKIRHFIFFDSDVNFLFYFIF